jgi:uncharacterized protein (TIGR02996 family)
VAAVLATDLNDKSAFLDAAFKLLTQGHDEGALESLVRCWREWPAPELADVIGLFVTRMTPKLPPITGAGSTSGRDAWLTVCAQHRTATIGRLFEVLPKTTGAFAAERIAALESWPPTPALSAAIARWLESPPFEGKNRARCFVPALKVLEAQRDVRVVPLLRRLTEASNRPWAIRELGLRAWKPLQALTRNAIGWRLPRPPSAAEKACLEQFRLRLIAPKAPDRESVKVSELYAAVFADPDDDTPRLMLADVLQERGDARGEFIALQIARAASGDKVSARERQLLGTWGEEWLGRLAPVLQKTGRVFQRGFLSECRFSSEHPPGELANEPAWGTVTHLDVFFSGQFVTGSSGLMLSPRFGALRHVSGVGDSDLRTICDARKPLPFESLRIAMFSLTPATWALFRDADMLPALTTLGLRSTATSELYGLSFPRLAELFDAPFGGALRNLEVAMLPEHFGELVAIAKQHRLTSLTLLPTSRAFAIRYDAGPRAMVVALDAVNNANLQLAAKAFGSAPRGTFDRVLVTLPGRAKVEREELVQGSHRASLKALRDAVGSTELVFA